MNGGDLYELAKIVGHSKITMTQRWPKLGKRHITRTGNAAREMWKLMEEKAGQHGNRILNVPVLFPNFKDVCPAWLRDATQCRIRGALCRDRCIQCFRPHPTRGGHVTAGDRGWMGEPLFLASQRYHWVYD